MASGLADDKIPIEFKNINHLGLEIRRALVERANAWAEGKGLNRSVRYVLSSANVSLPTVMKGYPGRIKFIAVQFPDPHFKRKHHKRRVVNESFIKIVSELLPEDAYFFVQSDVEEAAAQMRDRIDAFPKEFRRVGEYTPRDAILEKTRVVSGEGEEYWTPDGKRKVPGGSDYGDWKIGPNPMGVPTEREIQNEALGNPIYRALFQRNPK
jgi:tRNA (guanine-N7-)-methyltransferase